MIPTTKQKRGKIAGSVRGFRTRKEKTGIGARGKHPYERKAAEGWIVIDERRSKRTRSAETEGRGKLRRRQDKNRELC